MTAHPLISNATNAPSRNTLLGLPSGEGLGRRVDWRSRVETVRSNLTKRQIDVPMFNVGAGELEGLAHRLRQK